MINHINNIRHITSSKSKAKAYFKPEHWFLLDFFVALMNPASLKFYIYFKEVQ